MGCRIREGFRELVSPVGLFVNSSWLQYSLSEEWKLRRRWYIGHWERIHSIEQKTCTFPVKMRTCTSSQSAGKCWLSTVLVHNVTLEAKIWVKVPCFLKNYTCCTSWIATQANNFSWELSFHGVDIFFFQRVRALYIVYSKVLYLPLFSSIFPFWVNMKKRVERRETPKKHLLGWIFVGNKFKSILWPQNFISLHVYPISPSIPPSQTSNLFLPYFFLFLFFGLFFFLWPMSASMT